MKEKSAFAIVINNNNEILLTKRIDVPVWVLPGGGVEPDEDPRDAAVREVLEETGLDVQIVYFAAHYHPINTLAKETYLFTCKPLNGTPVLSNETAEVRYFSLNCLPSTLFLVHQIWIDDYLKAKGEKVERKLSEVNYSALIRYLIAHPLIFFKFLWTRMNL